MSLPSFSLQSELFSTAGLSGSLFAPDDRFRLFGQHVYPVLAAKRAKLEACYCVTNGRVAVEPVLLSALSVVQYLEGVPDRQAVELLRYHAGWNFALNRQLGDPVFHPTTLVNFRHRVLEHEQGIIGFEAVLEALVAAGLVARQSRQRLDSTQMFGRVSRMSRLDCVRESLRLALQELSEKTAPEERPECWPLLWERYVDGQVDYRGSLETLARKLVEAGADARRLLDWLSSPAGKTWAGAPQAQLLARVFGEQFEVVTGAAAPQPRSREELDSKRVQNPHDPEATYAAKGKGDHLKEHVGYKVQIAESVSLAVLAPGEPTRNFITGIVTHAALESDEQGMQKMESEQQPSGLDQPPVQYVDAAYISAQKLAQTAAQGRDLIGPAPGSPQNNGGRFTSEQFDVTVEQRKAICPAGLANTQCSRLEDQVSSKVYYRFEWKNSICGPCALRQQCIKGDHRHRTLVVGEYHTFLQTRRQAQHTDLFRQQMKHRNAIEGTQSEMARAHGLRYARYRGLAKAGLQNYFIGAACNIKRWLRRLAWEMRNGVTAAVASPAPVKSVN